MDSRPDFPGARYDRNGRAQTLESELKHGVGRIATATGDATRSFVQEDPIGFNGGLNLYAYANGMPLMGTDPMGTSMDGPCFPYNGGIGTTCIQLSDYDQDFNEVDPLTAEGYGAHGPGINGALSSGFGGGPGGPGGLAGDLARALCGLRGFPKCPGSEQTLQCGQVGAPTSACPHSSPLANLLSKAKQIAVTGLECAGAALSFSANVVATTAIVVGAGEVVVGGVGGLTAAGIWGVTGAAPDVGLASAGALISEGGSLIKFGAAPGLLTAVGAGGDVAAGDFNWLTSLIPGIGLRSAFNEVAANCPDW